MKVEEQHFTTIEAYIDESPGWELDVLQLSSGRLDFKSTLVTLPGVQLVWDHTGAKMEQHTIYQVRGIAFGMVLESDSRRCFVATSLISEMHCYGSLEKSLSTSYPRDSPH